MNGTESLQQDEDIATRVEKLSAIVGKQSQLLAKTGKQLLELQIKDVKDRMAGGSDNKVDLTDYATNEDLVQLVGELQGQLDYLEERNIRRIMNGRIPPGDKDKRIAPVLNRYGEEPPEDIFPRTCFDFENFDKSALLQLGDFYEIFVHQPEHNLDGESAEDNANHAEEDLSPKSVEERIRDITEEDECLLLNKISRYIGLNTRKGEDPW